MTRDRKNLFLDHFFKDGGFSKMEDVFKSILKDVFGTYEKG